MEDRTSIIKLSGLPDAFGVVLLVFGFVLVLAPYIPGTEFGPFKIPQFSEPARKRLKIIGPFVFLVFVTLFVPLIPNRPPSPADNANRNDVVEKKPSPEEINNEVQRHIKRARDLEANANFSGAIAECDEALRLEPDNQEALILRDKNKVSSEIANRNTKSQYHSYRNRK